MKNDIMTGAWYTENIFVYQINVSHRSRHNSAYALPFYGLANVYCYIHETQLLLWLAEYTPLNKCLISIKLPAEA